MLFNSGIFIFAFLPTVYLGFYAVGARHQLAASAWLGLASLVFYGWWSPRHVPLLLGSIVANYGLGHWVARRPSEQRRIRVAVGVTCNLLLLFYFKYAGFVLENVVAAADADWTPPRILLPLGISFFTFTQIAYLVDVHRGRAREANPLHYLLFVTYFPHLIAGPILHHAAMMPQFGRAQTYRARYTNVVAGLLLFTLGLLKKVVLADGAQAFVGPAFDGPANASLSFVEAFGGTLAYTLQLYFDFSGYSDMARGLSRLFNIEIPNNFDAPYRAPSIAEFWRRWHMTLSQFLRDYLYIPLGGNRHSPGRTCLNLFATMVLGGLWHGAGWTFLVWGALHGVFLVVNHTWRSCAWSQRLRDSSAWRGASHLLTLICVMLGWVFFRALDLTAAWNVVAGLAGVHGFAHDWVERGVFAGPEQLIWMTALLLMAVLGPTSQAIVHRLFGEIDAANSDAVLQRGFTRDAVLGAVLACVLLCTAVNQAKTVSEFIYFNF